MGGGEAGGARGEVWVNVWVSHVFRVALSCTEPFKKAMIH